MRRFLFICAAFLIIGCGPSVKYFPMNESPHSMPTQNVEVMSQLPDRPYVELGIIKVRERSKLASSPDKMMRLLREKARQIGADAIILQGVSAESKISTSTNKSTGEATVYTSTKDIVQGLAIAYK